MQVQATAGLSRYGSRLWLSLGRQYLVAAILLAVSFCVSADEIFTDFFSDKAAGGYDVVSYFKPDKNGLVMPLKGSKKYVYRYKNADWYFVNAENLAAFEATPEAYAPQYGGHCAWAMGANATKAPGDPKVWTMYDGRLYFNYNKNVQSKWEVDIPGFINKADNHWQRFMR